MSKADTPIACSLTGNEYLSRMAQIGTLFRRALLSAKRDGNALHLVFAHGARDDVARIVELERACCAFLDFDMHDGDTTIDLTITAPGGNAADDLLAAFTQAAVAVEPRA